MATPIPLYKSDAVVLSGNSIFVEDTGQKQAHIYCKNELGGELVSSGPLAKTAIAHFGPSGTNRFEVDDTSANTVVKVVGGTGQEISTLTIAGSLTTLHGGETLNLAPALFKAALADNASPSNITITPSRFNVNLPLGPAGALPFQVGVGTDPTITQLSDELDFFPAKVGTAVLRTSAQLLADRDSQNLTIRTVGSAAGGPAGAAQVAEINLQPGNYAGAGVNGNYYTFNGAGVAGSVNKCWNMSNVTTWDTTSDRRVKDEIEYIDDFDALEQVRKLRPVTYVMKLDPRRKRQHGFIAQEVLEAGFEDNVWSHNPSENRGRFASILDPEDADPILGLSGGFESKLVACVKALASKVDALEAANAEGGRKRRRTSSSAPASGSAGAPSDSKGDSE